MTADDTDADRRYRGILTPDDEAFLLGETENDPATNRDTRYRIRNRLRRGLLDLDLLYEHLPARDRSRIFGDLYEDRPDAFVSAIALYYLSA